MTMSKRTSIVSCLVLVGAIACKKDPPPAPAAAPNEAPSPTERPRPYLPPTQAPVPSAPSANTDTAAPALPTPAEMPHRDRAWRRGDRDQRLDTDGDGKVSEAEREAGRRARIENMRTRLDANGDGKVSPSELNTGSGRMNFDNPGALDTNGDGDISTDELQAALAARRAAKRAEASPDPQ
jgi:hypothetical protein